MLSLPRSDSLQGLLEYTAVGVDAEGLVSSADVAAAITPATVLVTVRLMPCPAAFSFVWETRGALHG